MDWSTSATRSNNRIQVFRKNGTFVKEKVIMPKTRGEGSVWDVAFSADPQQRFLYVADRHEHEGAHPRPAVARVC